MVGDEHLFRHAHHKGLHAGGEFVRGAGPLVDLIPQVLIFDDGSGNELRKQGDEGAEVDDGPLSPGVAPVDVDGVAHGLEGVEGDADGQMDAQHRHEGQAHGLQRTGQEVPVLEEQQQGQVEHDGGGHGHPRAPVVVPCLAPFHQKAVDIVDGGGEEHDGHIQLFTPVVEKQGGEQQYAVAQLPGHQVVDQKGQRQEIK